MSDKDKKKYEQPLKFDIPMDEVIKRVARVKKEDIEKEPVQQDLAIEGELQLTMFKGKRIRQIFHNNEWFFSVVDVIEAVTESDRPRTYWTDLKRRLIEKEDFLELHDKIVQLKIEAADGRFRVTDTVNVETLFRLIQSIPSKKAEPFKRFLAKVGYERIQEIQDPEISVKRAMLNWKIQGREDDWIEARLRAIVVRHELTTEWSKRGVKEGIEYGYLTNIISSETFGIKTNTHKKMKGLTSQSLRDHMTDLELVLTMLGEKSTSAITQTVDAQGLQENARAAKSGGRVAGDARIGLEKQLGKPVVSTENFLKGKHTAIPTRTKLIDN